MTLKVNLLVQLSYSAFVSQAARIHRLEQEMDRRQIQISAQQMALDGVGGERDAGRSTLQEALQRSEVNTAYLFQIQKEIFLPMLEI